MREAARPHRGREDQTAALRSTTRCCASAAPLRCVPHTRHLNKCAAAAMRFLLPKDAAKKDGVLKLFLRVLLGRSGGGANE